VQEANQLTFSPLLDIVRSVIQPDLPVYLVGGAVRDLFLKREVHDLDFAMPAYALETARAVANRLKAAYYPLDPIRQTGRVILSGENGQRTFLDFAVYRASDLMSDLRARDFTINAMAMELGHSLTLIDPLDGAQDMTSRLLRACSPSSFEEDPVRILRAVRLATELNFRIHSDTLLSLRRAIPHLSSVAPERSRDELFRILEGSKPAACMRALELLGVLPYLLPELVDLQRVEQSPPHIADIWIHTLDVVEKLELILNVLAAQYEPDVSANLIAGQVSLRIGRYRQQISEHLQREPGVGRSLRGLLLLGALYHDAGKPQTRQVEESGRVRFFNHDSVGAELVTFRGRELRLSNIEVDWLSKLVRHHMRPLMMADTGKTPSSRAIFRFFRDSGEAGVDVGLLSLADVWGTYGSSLPPDVWSRQVEAVRLLLESWWDKTEQVVHPPRLLDGYDLLSEFELSPGPFVGRLLDEIQEAQAAGLVSDRQQALDYARKVIRQEDIPPDTAA
jgi:poly(A) polymerase